MNTKRLVLDIQRMTVHNGPGMRTLILFKGCPLRCAWCSTPESQKREPEVAVYSSKCIHCNRCLSVCQPQAINLSENDLSIDRSKCNSCGECAQVCYAEALKTLGRLMPIENLVEEINKDAVIYRHSGGGVTLSGGEPLLDFEFNRQFLPALKKEGINIGMNTAGFVPWRYLEPLLPSIDFFLWDIKMMNSLKHKQFTGVPNTLILNNVRRLSQRKVPLYIRLPLIPGYNDSEANLRATCMFVQSLSSVVQFDLLPLHHLGKSRYESLDRPYPITDIPLIPDEVLAQMKRIVESYGLKCTIGG